MKYYKNVNFLLILLMTILNNSCSNILDKKNIELQYDDHISDIYSDYRILVFTNVRLTYYIISKIEENYSYINKSKLVKGNKYKLHLTPIKNKFYLKSIFRADKKNFFYGNTLLTENDSIVVEAFLSRNIISDDEHSFYITE